MAQVIVRKVIQLVWLCKDCGWSIRTLDDADQSKKSHVAAHAHALACKGDVRVAVSCSGVEYVLDAGPDGDL